MEKDNGDNNISENNISDNNVGDKGIEKCQPTKKYKLYFIVVVLFVFGCTLILRFMTKNKRDSYILNFFILSQMICLIGIKLNNEYITELSHFLFGISLVLGILLFTEMSNKLLVLVTLIITLSTRYLFNGCLFLHATSNAKNIFPFNINYNLIYIILFSAIIYRIAIG